MSPFRAKALRQTALAAGALAGVLGIGLISNHPGASALGASEGPGLMPPPAPDPWSDSSSNAVSAALSSKPPVDTFRELLAMTPAQRRRFLTGRSPEAQRQILAKVREYEAFTPNQRELRLKATELYYYLWPLMNTAASKRPPLLALVPERDRKEIEKRLSAWDRFPASRQQELLTNAAAVRYFTKLRLGPPPLPRASPAQEAKLESGIAQWQALPPAQQQKITARFKRFFELTPDEQQEACNTLSETERRQIERTLQRFENLSAADRAKAVRSFEKFARMSLEQRRQFLKNAELWKLMTPDQRENWRDLVNELPEQPPFPPGWIEPPPLPPGMAQGSASARRSASP